MNMKKTGMNRRGSISVIIVLIIAAVLLYILLSGSGKASEMSKDILGALAGTDRVESPMCEAYRNIKTTKNLTDLIVLASIGKCGGDTTESAFKFALASSTPIQYSTDKVWNELCGEHKYEVNGINYSITFGDIEYEKSDTCDYTKDESDIPWYECLVFCSFAREKQDCKSDNNNDLVIVTPGPANWMKDPCPTPAPTLTTVYTGCMHETGTISSHLSEFGLDPIDPSIGTWAIKKAGEDTVICFIG